MRTTLFIILVIITVQTTHSQTVVRGNLPDKDLAALTKSLNGNIDDIQRLEVLMKLVAYNLNHLGVNGVPDPAYTKATEWLDKAKEVNARFQSAKFRGIIALHESTIYRNRKATDSGLRLANQAIDQLKIAKAEYELPKAYLERSRYYIQNGYTDTARIINLYDTLFARAIKELTKNDLKELLFDFITYYHIRMRGDDHAVRRSFVGYLAKGYVLLNDKLQEFWARKEMADILYQQGQLPAAIDELLVLVKEQKEGNYTGICWTYDLLSGLYGFAGDFPKALYYSQQTLKNINNGVDSTGINVFIARIVYNYAKTGSIPEATEWQLKRINHLLTIKQYPGIHQLIESTTANLISLGKPEQALKLARENMHLPTHGDDEKSGRALALAQSYAAMKNDTMAQKYSEELIKIYNHRIEQGQLKFDMRADPFLAGYYLKRGQIELAEKYFKSFMSQAQFRNTNTAIKFEQDFLYKLAVHRGDYKTANTHLLVLQKINDSLYRQEKTRQIEELKVAYSTEQKEQNIQWLTKQDILQRDKLKQGVILRNVSFVLIGLLALIVVLVVNRYRLKQRTNKKLEEQQKEISSQNTSLRNLVSEKEWLVREIHHRVKNNLQTVMSLLNSQSIYIDNEPALAAIHDSQHRVQAMSLIHQKLYNSENISTINMQLYVRELVSYLKESFDAARRIHFDLNIEPVELDVSQAVPLGLILNEAITNSLKYAFPDNRSGEIAINLKAAKEKHYLLTIADNGIGIPSETKKTGSLGMNLMKGLTEDIDGSFEIKITNGTEINIEFEYDPGFIRHAKVF